MSESLEPQADPAKQLVNYVSFQQSFATDVNVIG